MPCVCAFAHIKVIQLMICSVTDTTPLGLKWRTLASKTVVAIRSHQLRLLDWHQPTTPKVLDLGLSHTKIEK